MKVVVIGANHAGTATINTILGNYPDTEVVVFDRNNNISFLGCGMALWIGDQIDGSDGLFYSNKEKLEANGAKVYMETEVYDIDFENKIVYAKSKCGKEFAEKYDKVIVSTGSLPINLPIPGKELENVQYVKLFQNAAEVIEKLKNPEIKHVTVIGAGYIGVELAEAFERKGKKVRLVDSCSDCLSTYYDKEFRTRMNEKLASHGIELSFGEMLKEIKGTDGKVSSIVTDKDEYTTDMVILCAGFRPNTDLLKEKVELFRNGAYLVDRTQKTSQEDVYAIGDCATIYDNSIDDVNYIALATNAVRSGIVAAHNVCGTKLEGIGVQGSNGISVYELNMLSTGLSEENAKRFGFEVETTTFTDNQKPEFMKTENDAVTVKIVYDKNTRRILGAQMASTLDISLGLHVFSLAIQEKVTIDKFKLLDIFFLPHFNKPYNYFTMTALGAK
ncbi:H2O-forming NADH oxidase [Streptobacillus moniliformis]|uniref:NADH oxidase n=1 Tax=Streptobacillus moniliformis (strain ATCC 14647 / DSM 12112 / NCTC 10651 / 9901) TaxID=519441 RepID=D1AYA4_STRM9|nr:FAD-dependent oxidoreductase [Streptobacillus moniliformis]ACZ01280.1 FAD-dependent pyridine nucleotide-disulphide oxidoreductase [Streptobacillus moniliformis DSM 12112]AVL42365.1 NADH oxidase [Streptobacillus moniliformis]QXW66020.1 FAD-dependent oxidoreductase [Streptobacillus moniliformis]SQA13562.1 Probable NADH oxidase [Streptobacillus moniliformis]